MAKKEAEKTELTEEEKARRENSQKNIAIATLRDWNAYDLLTKQELDDYVAKVMAEYKKDKENDRSIQLIVKEARNIVYARDEAIEALSKQGYQPKSTSYQYESDKYADKEADAKMDILAKFGYHIKPKATKPKLVNLKIAPKRIVLKRESFKAPRNTMPGQLTLFQFV